MQTAICISSVSIQKSFKVLAGGAHINLLSFIVIIRSDSILCLFLSNTRISDSKELMNTLCLAEFVKSRSTSAFIAEEVVYVL